MKTLFLKSNILHLRTNEGVFEVSNPEVAYIDDEGYGWWAYGLNAREKGIVRKIGITRADTVPHDVSIEWPGGVEFIFPCKRCDKEGGVRLPCIWDGCKQTKLARLIPEEKKAESAYKEFEEAAIKQGHVIESPEPQEKEQLIGHIIDDFKNHKEIFVEPVSAPSESQEEQEELWKEARHYIDVWRIEELFKRFKITRNP